MRFAVAAFALGVWLLERQARLPGAALLAALAVLPAAATGLRPLARAPWVRRVAFACAFAVLGFLWALAGRIRADLGMRDARLIALSGFGTEDDRRRSAQSGFDAHIVKPIDPATLPGVLAAFGARTSQ